MYRQISFRIIGLQWRNFVSMHLSFFIYPDAYTLHYINGQEKMFWMRIMKTNLLKRIMTLKKVEMSFFSSNLDETVFGEASQRNDPPRGATGLWYCTRDALRSVKTPSFPTRKQTAYRLRPVRMPSRMRQIMERKMVVSSLWALSVSVRLMLWEPLGVPPVQSRSCWTFFCCTANTELFYP